MTASWQGRKALITGGAGFLGATLAHCLVALGAEVTAVDNFLPEGGANPFNLAGLGTGFALARGDIGDAALMTPLIERADAIFNLAGRTGHMDSMSDPLGDLAANVTAQLGLLEICRARNPEARIVYASTRQFYGTPDYLPVDEKHALRPPDVNGVHKLAAEQHHLIYAKVHGLKATALRLTNCYGPRMRVKDARQTFVGIWIRRLLEGQAFEVWGGAQKRDFTYADDMADAFIAAVETPACVGNAYNIGGGGAVSLDALAEALVIANGGQGRFERKEFPADRKRIDIGDYEADDSAFRAATGWTARVDLVEGLRRSVDYYRANLAHYL
ncbi:MAG: NAD-dependent epimerase/dehydratase family protein [Alphaproteobacteria bacterium]